MNFIQNLSNREKILLFSLALILILFVGIQLLVRPAATTLTNDSLTLLNAQASAQQVEMQEQAVSGSQIALQKTLSEAAQSASWLFPSLDKPALQIWLMDIAKKSGFKVQAMSIGDPAAASIQDDAVSGAASVSGVPAYNMKTYADVYSGKTVSSATTASAATASSGTSSGATGDLLELSVNMQMSGSYDNAKKFLDAIKKTNKAVVVTAFSFAKTDKSDTCTATLQIYAAPKLDNRDRTLDWAQKKAAGKTDLMK